ncbi:hypothetical protein L6452_35127 [Arctium lappa]|uniref:Uncharacterized protein n=1 Tax=Arctium lappa TaxID=4217 RepID=A0ACB8YK76_ARCLA|nr:hypothetical protein L6452_35127 [Arctium lappa]
MTASKLGFQNCASSSLLRPLSLSLSLSIYIYIYIHTPILFIHSNSLAAVHGSKPSSPSLYITNTILIRFSIGPLFSSGFSDAFDIKQCAY